MSSPREPLSPREPSSLREPLWSPREQLSSPATLLFPQAPLPDSRWFPAPMQETQIPIARRWLLTLFVRTSQMALPLVNCPTDLITLRYQHASCNNSHRP